MGEEEWKAPEDGFGYAVDLIRFIRKTYGDHFVIAVGGQFCCCLHANSVQPYLCLKPPEIVK